MGLNRASVAALAVTGGIALAMPLLLLGPGTAPPVEMRGGQPLLAPTASPPLGALYGRTLFSRGPGMVDTTDAPLPADAPQLAGIAGRIGRDAVALVKGADGATRTLAVGEGVDGWRLESLAIDAAFFTRGTQRLRVPLPAG